MKRMCFSSSVSMFVLLAVMFFSCTSGEGTLTVTSYPVTGKVTVDGEPKGVTPVTLTLPSGNHEIRFSDYSDQYGAPGTRIVTLRKGEYRTVTGEYKNRFITHKRPAGFTQVDSLRIYGTAEKPLKDGTIFDYINGGGLVYLRYGLRETTHAVYIDEYSNRIILDIFDMGSPGGAQSAFNDEEICPPEFEKCDAATDCKAYNYEPDFLMYFHKSNYLVYISTTNDSLKSALNTWGASLADNIP